MNEGLEKDALESSPPGTLSRMALSGDLWTTLNTLITKILGGVKTVILARILSPADFGLMGLAEVAISKEIFAEMLSRIDRLRWTTA